MTALEATHPLPDPVSRSYLVLRVARNSKIPYRVHTRPPLFHFRPQINVAHISTLWLLGSVIILSSSRRIEISTFWCSPRFAFLLIEKLTGARLFKEFPEFDGSRRSSSIFITACHLSLSWTTQIHSSTFHPLLPLSFAQVHKNYSKYEAVTPCKMLILSLTRC